MIEPNIFKEPAFPTLMTIDRRTFLQLTGAALLFPDLAFGEGKKTLAHRFLDIEKEAGLPVRKKDYRDLDDIIATVGSIVRHADAYVSGERKVPTGVERIDEAVLQGDCREELLHRLVIDGDLPATGFQMNACDRRLAASGRAESVSGLAHECVCVLGRVVDGSSVLDQAKAHGLGS